MSPLSASTRLRSHWQALAQRERRLILGTAALVTLALLWWIGLSPALKVLRQSQQQQQSNYSRNNGYRDSRSY